ncbi:hypothetical protein CAPTEDRAFT_153090 [Capitella teleta]|uniref:Thioredoxin-like protein n=1 Tax=Capitella teleta TaxID=283909 RepID=R7V1G6_CAPTE|nr:hypothetical protein CAPTEDRAFT_153090 [Capitella teleta]|eukprot:ELU12404.1 hypothetical protein CAPTEDRAFT_153090 [Capitella teleta]
MSFLLKKLTSKAEVDDVIRSTEDLVLVLRFGRDDDSACLQMDNVMSKAEADLAQMARIFLIDVDLISVYAQYFDISLIPATVFFFNAQHIKVDWGTPDHTKFIGAFRSKQDFIDVVEVIFRGAMRGKVMVRSPLDPDRVPKYELIYKDI